MTSAPKKDTNFTRLVSVLTRASFHLSHNGTLTPTLVDRNGEKVGEVTFNEKDQFVAAQLYGRHFTSGRASRPQSVFNDFIDHIEECYAH